MKSISAFMQKYGVVVAFVLLFLIAALRQPDIFLKAENLRNLLNQNAPIGIVAIGMTLVIIAGGIDLSVGSIFALAACIGLLALNKLIAGGSSEVTASLLAVAVMVGGGGLLGGFNGVMVVFGRVAPFVATLVGLVAYRSMCLAIAEGGEIRSSSPDFFPSLGSGGVPIPGLTVGVKGDPLVITWGVFLFIAIALLAGFLLNHTRFGRYTIAVGANERAARYSAVATGRTKFYTYTLAGIFAGCAAVALSTRLNSVASSTYGLYYELDAIAAVVIGGTSLRGGSGRIWGTVVGVLLLGIITNILVLEGVSIYWQGVVKGAIILAAVLMQRGRDQ